MESFLCTLERELFWLFFDFIFDKVMDNMPIVGFSWLDFKFF